jgi:predicted enzyme related to lactoylglutathione lyase
MTHRSKLSCAYVDVPRRDFHNTARFYGELMGRAAEIDADEPDYASYGDYAKTGIDLYVQGVGDDTPRVHLDIETDDIEAEVARLAGLGATVVERIQGWVVMNDPVGNVFCVIKVQDADRFAVHATTWNIG